MNVPPPLGLVSKSKSKKKWVIEEVSNESWKFDATTATTHMQWNEDTDWKNAVGFQASEVGSEGIKFVGWEDNSVVVIKGSSSVMADYYAYRISEECRNSFSKLFPGMRLCFYKLHAEWKSINSSILHLNTLKTPSEQRQIGRFETLPIYTVMEYVPVVQKSFQEITPENWREIGNIMAFDVFINNWDRLPLIWDHQGNIDNIMFSKDGSVKGIDQSVTGIYEAQKPEYLERVSALLEELTRIDFSKFEVPKCFEQIIECFKLNHYDVTPNIMDITYGVMEGFLVLVLTIELVKY